jgi:hypothetical protein
MRRHLALLTLASSLAISTMACADDADEPSEQTATDEAPLPSWGYCWYEYMHNRYSCGLGSAALRQDCYDAAWTVYQHCNYYSQCTTSWCP